jgi:hypothetical protein
VQRYNQRRLGRKALGLVDEHANIVGVCSEIGHLCVAGCWSGTSGSSIAGCRRRRGHGGGRTGVGSASGGSGGGRSGGRSGGCRGGRSARNTLRIPIVRVSTIYQSLSFGWDMSYVSTYQTLPESQTVDPE